MGQTSCCQTSNVFYARGFRLGNKHLAAADLSVHGDEMSPEGFLSNHAGGVLGGISTGQTILASIAIKPTSSIRLPRNSVNLQGEAVMVETFGRHDPCVGIRATPIAEAMVALVLMDHALRHRAQNSDVKCETPVIPASLKGQSR